MRRARTVQSSPPENRMAILASVDDALGGSGTWRTRYLRESVRWVRKQPTEGAIRVNLFRALAMETLNRPRPET